MKELVVSLYFEIFTVHSVGDNDVMCFNSMNESKLKIKVSGRCDVDKRWNTSKALTVSISLKQASTELQNAIRTAARMTVVLEDLVTDSEQAYAEYELSDKENNLFLIRHKHLEEKITMLAADIVKIEEEIIIPNLRNIGVDVEEFNNDELVVDLNVYYTDEFGMSFNRKTYL